MTDAELDNLLMRAFLLGKQVTMACGLRAGSAAEEEMRSWNLLRNIARGQGTLAGEFAEVFPEFAGLAPEILEERTRVMRREERELAARLIGRADACFLWDSGGEHCSPTGEWAQADRPVEVDAQG